MNRELPHTFYMRVLADEIEAYEVFHTMTMEEMKRTAHASLMRDTGVDLGYDAQAWRDWFVARPNWVHEKAEEIRKKRSEARQQRREQKRAEREAIARVATVATGAVEEAETQSKPSDTQ